MNFHTFKAVVAKWAAETVIPAIVPEGMARWAVAFAGMAKVNEMLDQYASVIPMTNGEVDIDELDCALRSAFAVQPTLAIKIPQIPQLAAIVGETTVRFSQADADALITLLKGKVTNG